MTGAGAGALLWRAMIENICGTDMTTRDFRLLSSKAVILYAMTALALTGCGSRPSPETLATVDTRGIPKLATEQVFAMTTRGRIKPDENMFDNSKAIDASYAAFTVSIPPNHKSSEVEWPGAKADPKKTFAIAGQKRLDQKEFIDAIDHADPNSRDIGIFVHGYNNSYQEALFRMAQMGHDANIPGAKIVFSWPSQAELAGYVADKEGATYSRDYLAQLLIEATKQRKTGEVYVFAHSMGCWLTVETLRQLKLAKRDDVLDKLKVVLASPDIDADVFRTQMQVIGKMKLPMTILVAPDDRALEVSKLLSASSQRLGALDVHNPQVLAAAERVGIQFIDISSVKPLDSTNHNRFADVAVLAPALRDEKKAGIKDAGAFVFNAAAATVSSPFRIVSGVLSQ
ncbi:esterase/lipase superfamily enzyme [Rhizobium sp. SG_E_25_P2]|uniref:alpha/beta hydrolase n=1 Tax=Rhizobium sp. SG_E_25_P2 TaxID=2879942 RepID=UPI002473D9F4|nr:alpha/beta hydrolase [Rhizobium sp. SG_E_25_P2]MDH6268450.1 esterase/lipase superfamily enzyme [Rhizobium sp. SG_E_25_P2]